MNVVAIGKTFRMFKTFNTVGITNFQFIPFNLFIQFNSSEAELQQNTVFIYF